MTNQLSKDQINDSGIVEEEELSSTAFSGSAFSSASIVSTNSGSKQVVFSGIDLFDPRVSQLDFLVIVGGAAAGTYSVDQIVNETTLSVSNSIITTASSGVGNIYYRDGADITGFDPTGTTFDPNDDTVRKALIRVREEGSTTNSPGFSYGRNGNLNGGVFLYRVGGVVSSTSGINVSLFSPALQELSVSVGITTSFSFDVMQHDGGGDNLTLISTINVPGGSKQYTIANTSPLIRDRQIAVRITPGSSAKNLGVDIVLTGSIVP